MSRFKQNFSESTFLELLFARRNQPPPLFLAVLSWRTSISCRSDSEVVGSSFLQALDQLFAEFLSGRIGMTKVDFVLPRETFTCSSEETLSVSEVVTRNIPSNSPAKARKKFPNNSSGQQQKLKFPNFRKFISRRKNNRRKRKWKPYCKLTWLEKRQLEERDSRRAVRIREEMTAIGLPLAPYNTTQFLIEDHNVQEPDYKAIANGFRHREGHRDAHVGSSEEFYSSPEDEEEFLQKEFVQTYEDLHAERLENMTQSDLVEEFVSMEDKVEELEKTLQEARLHKKPAKWTPIRPSGFDVAAELEKIRVFRAEIEKLTLENDFLDRENETLRRRLAKT